MAVVPLTFNRSAFFIGHISAKFNVLKTFYLFCVVLKGGRYIYNVSPGCILLFNIFCIHAAFVPNVAVENRCVNNSIVMRQCCVCLLFISSNLNRDFYVNF